MSSEGLVHRINLSGVEGLPSHRGLEDEGMPAEARPRLPVGVTGRQEWSGLLLRLQSGLGGTLRMVGITMG
jgi:hypothetical protein